MSHQEQALGESGKDKDEVETSRRTRLRVGGHVPLPVGLKDREEGGERGHNTNYM